MKNSQLGKFVPRISLTVFSFAFAGISDCSFHAADTTCCAPWGLGRCRHWYACYEAKSICASNDTRKSASNQSGITDNRTRCVNLEDGRVSIAFVNLKMEPRQGFMLNETILAPKYYLHDTRLELRPMKLNSIELVMKVS